MVLTQASALRCQLSANSSNGIASLYLTPATPGFTDVSDYFACLSRPFLQGRQSTVTAAPRFHMGWIGTQENAERIRVQSENAATPMGMPQLAYWLCCRYAPGLSV